jgi:D-aspartate ligase
MPEPLVGYAGRFMEHIHARYGLRAICLYSDARAAHYQRRLLPEHPERVIAAQLVARAEELPALCRDLERKYRIAGIVPAGEAAVAPAARWEELLGTGWNSPEVLRRFRDKLALKARLRAVDPGLPLGPFRLVRGVRDVLEPRFELPARFVLKPNDGMGNRGVGFFTRDASPLELEAFFAAGHGRAFLLEEFLVGQEHCVNGQMDASGNPIITQIMRDERTLANGMPNVYCVTHHLPRTSPAHAPLAAYAERVMRATGLRRCPFHMEVMFDEALGPRLIEVGARLGGSDLAAACDDVHGGSFDTIAVASHYYLRDEELERTGLDWAHYDRVSFAIVAGISRDAGLVHNVRGVDEVEQLPEFRRWDKQVKPGDVLSPTVDLFTIPYSVHLRSYRGEEAIHEAAERVRALVRWNVSPSAGERAGAALRRLGTKAYDRITWTLGGEAVLAAEELAPSRDGAVALAHDAAASDGPSRSPALLTTAGAYGTLAAIRCLGRSGIAVCAADADALACGLASRFASRKLRCPESQQPDALLEWLLRFGDAEARHVLHPTSDETAWLFAASRDELARRYFMFQPPLDTLYSLLNKKRLHAASMAAGFDVPETWFPGTLGEIDALAPRLPYPVVIKPQTQVFLADHVKGLLARSPAELRSGCRAFLRKGRYAARIREHDPGVVMPILQRYYPGALENVYSISGFFDEATDTFATRASRKVLQCPRPFGVGLCFDAAPVEPALARRVHRLCLDTGFHGAFEVELIPTEDGRHLLNDFNPRYYGQMAFEIARGLPIPLMVHAAATGDRAWLLALASEAVEAEARGEEVTRHAHRFLLDVTRQSQRVAGRLAGAGEATWKDLPGPGTFSVDAVDDPLDPRPAMLDRVRHLRHWARHPRDFVRCMVVGSRP